NILELAKEKKSKSVVYVSSMEMYGAFDYLNHDVTENDLGFINPLNLRSNYPESKRLCENMCIAYLSEYDVPVKIARLAQTFGAGILPGENRVFAQFAKSAIKGEDIVLHTKGLSEGNYCYTRDCITGLFTILLKGKNGEAYNVSNPESHTTIADMAKMVAEKIASSEIKVVFDIPKENTFGYASDTKMKLNSDKLQSLGWKPEVSLEESYRRMIEDMISESEFEC
ncbi:MAG: NAD-dependent epimerase/dehydratase family protein, partial [Floccifex sp.]